jgi:uncharacterized protein (TIGR00290 family)
MKRPRAVLAWSSGKDCAWALHVLRQENLVEVVGLLCTVNEHFDRVAMHGVRSELLRTQATAVGLPLHEVPIPWPCSNEAYESAMAVAVERLRHDGVSVMAFGDLFLDGIRKYREDKLRGTGLVPSFPLWGSLTGTLAREMIAGGLRARLTCIDPKQLPAEFAGREFDVELLGELPEGVDPCGEHGEFHSFAYDGPMFRHAVPIRTGEIVDRDGFVFADLLLGRDQSGAV